MEQRERQKELRRTELQKYGAQDLLRLAKQKGINLLNGPFVVEQILDDEFPELKQTEL